MKISAVICELNPAHNGHKHVFEYAKKDSDCVIAVMSGNFTQRSECALFDKYTRAEDALKIGADLVVELPSPWSSASAEFFASAGVSIAASMGADRLVFGSECGDIDSILRAASADFSEALTRSLKSEKDKGSAVVREKTGVSLGLDAELFRNPNNILAIEYCKSAIMMAPYMRLETVKRQSGAGFISASELRSSLIEENCAINSKCIPFDMHDTYLSRINSNQFASVSVLADIEREWLLLNSSIDFAGIFDATGGVGERLRKAAVASANGVEMFSIAATKKYTDSRLRRAAVFSLLGVTEEVIRSRPSYTVLLGANATGREYLSLIRKSNEFPIITKPSDSDHLGSGALKQYKISAAADVLYTLCYTSKELRPDHFIKKSPIIC